jgi:hypothetical protein
VDIFLVANCLVFNSCSLLIPKGCYPWGGSSSDTWEAKRSSIRLICCSVVAALAHITGKERHNLCLPLFNVPFLNLARSTVSVL